MADLGKVILLDMDGTITPARKAIDGDMLFCLIGACLRAEISIVSGSDYDYVYEQCGKYFIQAGIAELIVLMPCNGTKVYKYDRSIGEYVQTYSTSMSTQLGEKSFSNLMSGIIKGQAAILDSYDIPISGDFIANRGSTLNWCPIGRSCSAEERKAYTVRPDSESLRLEAIMSLKKRLPDEIADQLEFSLGGQTSIDIFPKGWDKTFSLTHYANHKFWFVGDRCEEGENDVHIYKLLEPHGRGFKTSGPKETIKIIDKIIDDIVAETTK